MIHDKVQFGKITAQCCRWNSVAPLWFSRCLSGKSANKSSAKSSHIGSDQSKQNNDPKEDSMQYTQASYHEVEGGYIGPPDPLSRMRFKVFDRPSDETAAERRYREKRESLQEAHFRFWAENNSSFAEGKARVMAKHKAYGKEAVEEALAEYYRDFLNAGMRRHRDYSRWWWYESFALAKPAALAHLSRLSLLWQKQTGMVQPSSSSSHTSSSSSSSSSTATKDT
eukprot:Clim_evm13s216 gene=Clim_evmTU13s216